LYMSIWGQDTLAQGKKKFQSIFEDITNSLFTEDYVMAMGGPDNFRLDLYVDYKASKGRVKSKSTKPDWFDDLKSWTVSHYDGCILTDNFEADDIVRVWALELDKAGINRCVVTVDKDLDCIPGNHYNPRTKAIYQVSEEWADYFYWKQLLMGDSVDNIPGIKGIGPKKAEKILEGSTCHNEHKRRICLAYDEAFGEDGFAHMLLNGKLLHIWRKIDDHFKLSKEVYEAAIAQ
jgi:hypothetical protein